MNIELDEISETLAFIKKYKQILGASIESEKQAIEFKKTHILILETFIEKLENVSNIIENTNITIN